MCAPRWKRKYQPRNSLGVQNFSFRMNSDFAGLLEVDYFRIYDKAGNSKTYDKEDLDLFDLGKASQGVLVLCVGIS